MKKVALIMGSDSDLPIMEKGIQVLKDFEVPFEVHVYSAHRCINEALEFANKAIENDFGVIVCGAGMAAHLGGVIASSTVLPVISIPCSSKHLEGMDALLSTVMMPKGVPVACVGIDNASNACLLAIEILALNEPKLLEKLQQFRIDNRNKVLEKNELVSKKYN